MSMKNPLTPAGIEPATFRFLTQHLNHCATAVRSLTINSYHLSKQHLLVGLYNGRGLFYERYQLNIYIYLYKSSELGSSVGIATGYGLDGPGIESRWGRGEIFRTCPDRPWGPPSFLYSGYRVFPGGKSGRGVTLTPHPFLVPWSRKSRAIPLLLLRAVRSVQSLSASTGASSITYSTVHSPS